MHRSHQVVFNWMDKSCGNQTMNPFKLYRYWRICRLERKIAYLKEFVRFYSDPETGKVPYYVSEYHGIADKISKIKEYEKTIYHLREF